MSSLNNLDNLTKIDKSGMIGRLESFPSQVEEAEKQADKFSFPTHYIKARNILIAGMGGSAIGGDLAKSVAEAKETEVPIEILRDYILPAYVGEQTLFIASSYSGETEETLSSFEQAAKKGAKLIVISSGGTLASLGRKYKAPIFEVKFQSTPRESLAYSFVPILKILQKIGKINFDQDEFKEALLLLKAKSSKFKKETPTSSNFAKQLAEKIQGKIPIVYSSGPLSQVGRRWKTQLNENSKTTSFFEILPELCHNSIVGYDFPDFLKNKAVILVLQSRFDHPKNTLRQKILFSILQEKNINYESIFSHPSPSILSEVLQMIMLGDFTSYYLAILENIDPTPVEIIGYLKQRLATVK